MSINHYFMYFNFNFTSTLNTFCCKIFDEMWKNQISRKLLAGFWKHLSSLVTSILKKKKPSKLILKTYSLDVWPQKLISDKHNDGTSRQVAGVSLPSTPYCAIQAATWPLALASCTHEAMNLAASGIPFLQPTLCKENVVILRVSKFSVCFPVELYNFGIIKFYNNLQNSMFRESVGTNKLSLAHLFAKS